jgi:hypothetical protein
MSIKSFINQSIHLKDTRNLCLGRVWPQEPKYVESLPNTTSAWAGWSRFDIPVNRYCGVHSQIIGTSSAPGSPTCHQASQQDNTYWTKYQKADRASTLCTLWSDQRPETRRWPLPFNNIYTNCSGQKTPDSSWCCLSEALGNLGSGNLEGGGFGERVGKGRSVYKQPETEVDGSCHS